MLLFKEIIKTDLSIQNGVRNDQYSIPNHTQSKLVQLRQVYFNSDYNSYCTVIFVCKLNHYDINCQYYYNSSIVRSQISNGKCTEGILLERLFTSLMEQTNTIHAHTWLGYCQSYFVLKQLVYLSILVCTLIIDTNISTLTTFTGFQKSIDALLIAIRINHVDLLSSHVQHNDDCHFAVVNV